MTPAVNLPPVLSTILVANNGIISDWLHLKSNLKETIFLYVNYTFQKCMSEQNNQTFLIEDLFHLPLASTTLVVQLELRISLQIFKKIWNGPNGISGAWGKLIHEKTWSRKSCGTVPLRQFYLEEITLYAYIVFIHDKQKRNKLCVWRAITYTTTIGEETPM